jgi:phenylalanyl-tRNA synthetase beta chain
MNISYGWIRSLVPGLELTAQQVADRLAMLGAPVDEITDVGGPLRDVIIGRVQQVQRHPNADRLSVCLVDAGAHQPVQVVCGAPNVAAGRCYPFVPAGATLPGGVVIRRTKIRGQESQGMLCSPRELGLGRDHEGIMELHGEFEPGRSFTRAVGLDDTRLVVDITPNRPDLLCHLGVAREVAAATGLRAVLPPLPGAQTDGPPVVVHETHETDAARASAGGVTIDIEDTGLCPRYIGLVIRDVRIGPSPEWLAARLRTIGLRPISNVVDATNYVLHELGQPLHAFDLHRLGEHVVVRAAREGEGITTLDGVHRTLAAGMLVIADRDRPVAIAGVMGGAETEVDEDTRDLLLECAVFDARSVRATRRALGLSTDASYRFERGVDADGLPGAVRRAAELIIAAAGGTAASAAAAAGPGLEPAPPLTLRLPRVEQVLGTAFSAPAIAGLLRPLGFDVAERGGSVVVGVPGHRRADVTGEEDLIEEIARHHGYDAFPDELRASRPSSVPTHPIFLVEDRLRDLLVGRGFLEARTAPFAPEAEGDVALLLPLAATESRLRRALLPGLLHRAEHNFARGIRAIRLFELGTAFDIGDEAGLPREATRLALVCTGPRHPPHWTAPAAAFDVWDLKGLAAELAADLGLSLQQRAEHPLLDEALSFSLLERHNGAVRGSAGQVRAGAVDAPPWADDLWALEVELAPEHAHRTVRYRAVPAFPAIERDLALLVPDQLPAAAVGRVVASTAELLESAEPFDVYSGSGVPAGVRSIAFRLRFRAPDRTLTDTEIDDVVHRILRKLHDELGVSQRA